MSYGKTQRITNFILLYILVVSIFWRVENCEGAENLGGFWARSPNCPYGEISGICFRHVFAGKTSTGEDIEIVAAGIKFLNKEKSIGFIDSPARIGKISSNKVEMKLVASEEENPIGEIGPQWIVKKGADSILTFYLVDFSLIPSGMFSVSCHKNECKLNHQCINVYPRNMFPTALASTKDCIAKSKNGKCEDEHLSDALVAQAMGGDFEAFQLAKSAFSLDGGAADGFSISMEELKASFSCAEEKTKVSLPSIVLMEKQEIPKGYEKYPIENMLDGSVSTAWARPINIEASGRLLHPIGFDVYFLRPKKISAFNIVSGYAKNPTLFGQNHRLKQIKLTTDPISRTEMKEERLVSLKDTIEKQTVPFTSGYISRLHFEIESVFPGTKFHDVAVSEISFEFQSE